MPILIYLLIPLVLLWLILREIFYDQPKSWFYRAFICAHDQNKATWDKQGRMRCASCNKVITLWDAPKEKP